MLRILQKQIVIDKCYQVLAGVLDNPFVESLNGSFRNKCLKVNLFMSIEDAKKRIETWKHDYNHFRSHPSLADDTQAGFAGPLQLPHPNRIFLVTPVHFVRRGQCVDS